MSEYSLFCNFKKCRVAITSYAWITSCSHAFCEQHTDQEPEMCVKCLACDSPLKSKYDLVRVDLNPSEEFKSMVLSGLRPEIIMDIASRGISFWCHQMYQEKVINIAKATQAESQLNQVGSSYETLTLKMKKDREVESKNIECLKKKIDEQDRRIQELESCLNKKSQQLRSLQMKLESMKRENLSASLSQCVRSPPPYHVTSERHVSPKYMTQQSMLHCPVNFSQQQSYHQRMQHKPPDKSTANDTNFFLFKPNSSEKFPPSQQSNRFNFTTSKND